MKPRFKKIEKEKFLNCNFDCCHTFELMIVKFQFLKLQSPFTISSDRLSQDGQQLECFVRLNWQMLVPTEYLTLMC